MGEVTAMVNGMTQAVLVMAMDLGRGQWRVAFTIGAGQRPRIRTISAEHWRRLGDEIGVAKVKLGVPPDARVVSCYEAGPDGFWIHRYLTTLGVDNLVVDPASIEMSRRGRQAKTDRLDVERLLALLLRYVQGERAALRLVRVPTDDAEDRRQLHREFITTTHDRVRVRNRIYGLLATQGLHVPVHADFARRLPTLHRWDGQLLSAAMTERLAREWTKVELLTAHLKQLETARHEAVQCATDPMATQVRQLLTLRGIGEHSAWVFVAEHFSWRQLRNRREVGALAGLVPLPHKSGSLDFDRGISKAGSRRVRSLAVQIAWMWVRYQPQSALTQWWQTRFAAGGRRSRKIGIVAVARRLLIDLWRYLEHGVIPEGATVIAERRFAHSVRR
ncbi:MAG TPA: IS110 family transposase [Gemmatimonadales bacterium]